MNIVEIQRARIQTLEKRIQELESTSTTILALEKEIGWLEGVIFNPSYNDTDIRLLVGNTPREMRMGLTTEFPEENIYLPVAAKKAHCNEKTASKRFRRFNEAGVLSYRSEKDEAGKLHARLKILPPMETAPIIQIDRPKEGGSTWEDGKRVKRCKDCNSANLVKKITSQIICADCGVPQEEAVTVIKMVNSPDCMMEEEEDHRHCDTDDLEEKDHRHCDADPLEESHPEDGSELPCIRPITTPPRMSVGEYPLNGFSLEDWLSLRRGHGAIIYSTGMLDQAKKYLHKPAGYEPNIAAYIRGDLQHIYGSRPARDDGTTYVFGADCDKPELDAQHQDWQKQLASAGIASIYWMRRPGRGHLEVYTDQPVDRKAFYAHLLNVCPGLAAIPECFPIGKDQNIGGDDRADFPYSWPLYYRTGNQVVECAAEVMFPGDPAPMCSTGIQSDHNRLQWLISQAIMPASNIPVLPLIEEETRSDAGKGGLLLDKPSPIRSIGIFDDGLAKVVIAEFNDGTRWEDIAEVENGRIRASWRDEKTPSVVINADGSAHDYGKTGAYPKHFDKFEAYCLINGLNKREELKRRIAAYPPDQGRIAS